MKRWILSMLCLPVLLLCACGSSAGPAPVETAAPVATASPEPSVAATPTPSAAPAQRQSTLPGASLHAADAESEAVPASEEDAADAAAAAEALERAMAFLDRPLEELLAEFGEPLSREYGPSCLGNGKDGELAYDAFTVYTYQSDDGERVTGVK